MEIRTRMPMPVRICVATGALAIATQAFAAAGGMRVTVTAEDGRPIGGVVAPTVRVVQGKTVPVAFVLRRDDELIEEVVVVADAIRSDAYGAASSSYFDRERLRTATGSGADVLRALDGLPGLMSTGEFANFTVRGRGPRDNLILVDGFPYDKVVHFDSSLGEWEDIAGGGRYSIFAPNLIGRRGVFSGRLERRLRRSERFAAEAARRRGQPEPVREPQAGPRRRRDRLRRSQRAVSGYRDHRVGKAVRFRPAVRHHRSGRHRQSGPDRRHRQDAHQSRCGQCARISPPAHPGGLPAERCACAAVGELRGPGVGVLRAGQYVVRVDLDAPGR